MMAWPRIFTNYAIASSAYGVVRAVVHAQDAVVKDSSSTRELLWSEAIAGVLASSVTHVMFAPNTLFDDAIAIERFVRDIPSPRYSGDELPFPLTICFPRGTVSAPK